MRPSHKSILVLPRLKFSTLNQIIANRRELQTIICDLLKISKNTLKVASCMLGRYRIEENRHIFWEITSRTAIWGTDNWWDHWLQIGSVWTLKVYRDSNKDDFVWTSEVVSLGNKPREVSGMTATRTGCWRRELCSNGASYQWYTEEHTKDKKCVWIYKQSLHVDLVAQH